MIPIQKDHIEGICVKSKTGMRVYGSIKLLWNYKST